jgi:hypothetical protein
VIISVEDPDLCGGFPSELRILQEGSIGAGRAEGGKVFAGEDRGNKTDKNTVTQKCDGINELPHKNGQKTTYV